MPLQKIQQLQNHPSVWGRFKKSSGNTCKYSASHFNLSMLRKPGTSFRQIDLKCARSRVVSGLWNPKCSYGLVLFDSPYFIHKYSNMRTTVFLSLVVVVTHTIAIQTLFDYFIQHRQCPCLENVVVGHYLSKSAVLILALFSVLLIHLTH